MAEPDHSPALPASSPPQAAALELGRAPGHLVRCAQQTHSALWHAEFGTELTSPQYAVLSILSDHPNSDQRTAGSLASLDKSNIADVVRRLELRGWLTRERDALDGRRNLLRLTGAAETALSTLSPRVAKVQDQLLGLLTDIDQDQFLTLLARVAYRSSEAVPRPDRTTPTPAVEVSTAPGHLLRRAEQVHYALWFEEFGSGVTSPQYALISALLHAATPLDQRTAGEIASLDKSSLADVVRRLESRGWLTRVRDRGDGRRRILRLSPVALYAIPQVTEGVLRVQERLVAPLTAGEPATLVRGLAAIAGSGR